MVKKFYKVVLALCDIKLLDCTKYFIFSYDMKNKKFIFWFISLNGIIEFYSSCDNPSEAKFQWEILMKRRSNDVFD